MKLKQTAPNEKVEMLKLGFKQYLNSEYAYLKDKNVIYSDAFYPLRHNIGIDFWNVFVSKESMKRCREKLEIYFKEANRKTPRSDASTHMNAIEKLKKYIDSSFGGVDKYLLFYGNEFRSEPELNYENDKTLTTRRVRFSNKIDIPQPCYNEVKKYLIKWDTLEAYSLQESALDKLFFRTYPTNTDIDDVLIKVSALNDFYSTNIFSPFQVAKHIISLKIDDRIQLGDVTLVNDITKVTMENGKVINFYSFASKYCSHHKPLDFPIYDSYVDKLLRYFRNRDKFFHFKNDDLKNYVKFKSILIEFKKYYKLEPYSLKEIDKYLWQLGKEKIPNQY